MSKLHMKIMFWSKTLWCKTCIIINYHSVSLDSFKNRSKNESYAFVNLTCEININEIMETKYY